MTDMVTYTPPSQTALTIADEQHRFTEAQTQALAHIGVENASQGDLDVFFHVVKRTGLDPFARQIYMIGRQASERDAQGNWVKVTKQTIQTGIDGYRLIGRRAAARTGETISVEPPEWCRDNGAWVPVWSAAWGLPLAARVTIRRDGQPFTAIANFDEYKQTKRDGSLNAMWTQRPAGQIAKCAEAAAWRMAFPQDLADIYTDDEMGQADNPPPAKPRRETAATLLAPAESAITAEQWKRLGTLLKGVDADKQLRITTQLVQREITSPKELTEAEASELIRALEDLADQGPLADMVEALLAPEPGTAEPATEPAAPEPGPVYKPATQGQLTKLHTVLTKLDIGDGEKHQIVGTLARREISTTKDLDRKEIGLVIDILDGCLKDADPEKALDFALANANEGGES